MNGFLCILLASALITAIFLLFQALGGAALGAGVEEVNLFFCPILSVRVGKVRFRLGCLPSGGSVKFSDGFASSHPARKIAVALCGLLSYALVSLVCLGLDGTLHHVATSYGQMLRGAFSPLDVGAKLIGALAAVFGGGACASGVGILAAKFLAYNSLPLGVLSGGFIVQCLIEMAGLRSEKFTANFQLAGLVVALLFSAAWAVAFLGALGRTL